METSVSIAEYSLVNTQIDEYYEDIKSDNITNAIADLSENPYPGLRPFRTSESPVFFGRQEICLELIKRLSAYNFLAVIGASGTGKSSLVRAGLLPKLQSLPGKFGEWRVAIFRPGQDPFANLGRAILEAEIFSNLSFPTIVDSLKESSFGFELLFQKAAECNKQMCPFNTLIIIDQFEELFRYRRDNGISGQNDAALFVKMLIGISEKKDLNTYVLLTMRTEYLNDCVQIPDLAEKINKGQFLVPGLNITQLKETIILPLMLTGAKAEEGIENKIIGELGEVKDQLPVLQHALRATFEYGKINGPSNGGELLALENYKNIGKIQNALSLHAKRLYDSLTEKQKHYCKLLFQCITERTNDGRLIRRPKPFETIFKICAGVSPFDKEILYTDLTDIINLFRAESVCFLMPPSHVPLNNDIEIDISHESLMRNWTELQGWIDDEVYYGNLYRFLTETRKTSERKPGSDQWITGGKLDDLIEWRDNYTNNPEWAARYTWNDKDGSGESSTDAYDKNLRFLAESIREDEERIKRDIELKNQFEVTRLKAEEIKLKYRRRNIVILFAVICVLGFIFGLVLIHKDRLLKVKTEQVEKDAAVLAGLLRKARIQELAAQLSDSTAKSALLAAHEDSLNADKFFKLSKSKEVTLENERRKFLREKVTLVHRQALILSSKMQQKDLILEGWYEEVIKSDIQNSKLSSIASIDSTILKDAAQYSLNLIKNQEKDDYHDFLDEMNSAFELNNRMDSDPSAGLREIKRRWGLNNNPIIDKLILDIINNHLYYKQKLLNPDVSNKLFLNNNPFGNNIQHKNLFAYLSFPNEGEGRIKDRTHPLFVSLRIGKLDNDSLILNEGLNSEPVNYLQFTDNGMIGMNNKGLFHWSQSGVMNTNMLKDKPNEEVLAISNDGKFILSRHSKTSDCRIWKTSDYIAAKNPISIENTKNITSVQFSPEGTLLLIMSLNGAVVYELEDGHLGQKHNINRKINSQNFEGKFTAKSERLIFYSKDLNKTYSSKSSLNQIYLSGLDDKIQDNISVKYPDNTTGEVQSVSLSDDFKTLLIESPSRVYVLNRNNGDSILSDTSHKIRSGLKYTPLPVMYSKAAFLDDKSFITYDKLFNIYLWKLNGNFTDLNTALSSIKLPESASEKVSSNKMTFEQAFTSNDKNDLLDVAKYYNTIGYNYGDDTTDIARSKAIYFKLLNMKDNSPAEIISYAGYISIMNDYLLEVGREKYFEKNVNYLKENIFIEEKYFSGSQDIRKLSTYYGNLSWYSFFTEDFTNALEAAKKGIEIDSTNGFIKTNLVLGLLFTHNFAKAEEKYNEYKDQKYNYNTKFYRQGFKDDFIKLKKHGIIGSKNKEIYNEVKLILTKILGFDVSVLD